MAKGWHILTADGHVTVARHMPARFDVAARTCLPGGDALRLAMQIRQDMWRALRKLRGFSPVVRISPGSDGLSVTAGGRVAGPVPSIVAPQIETLLQTETHRARWLRCAGYRG